MPYFSPDLIAKAKEIDLLTYLQNNNPDELVHFSRNVFTTKTHDSLKISNGKWYWHSRGVGSKTALDYLVMVEGYSFLRAVEHLLGFSNSSIYISKPTEKISVDKLILPIKSSTTDKVKEYLMNRGIDESIIQECIDKDLIYEEKKYHNVVFVGYDNKKNPRYAGIRSSNNKRFMKDATGSNKAFSFRLESIENTDTIHLFESAIDLLSFATLLQMSNKNINKYTLISLAGVYQPAKELHQSKVPIAINYYLNQHQNIKKIFIHFDNDNAGRTSSLALQTVLSDRYDVIDSPPPKGKDYNDYLCFLLNNRKKQLENIR